jgi:hypothetical protein
MIVAQFCYEKVLEQEEILEIELENENDNNAPQVTTTQAFEMCRTLGNSVSTLVVWY